MIILKKKYKIGEYTEENKGVIYYSYMQVFNWSSVFAQRARQYDCIQN